METNLYWLWLLSMGSLIFLMQAGFFLLEGGQVSSRDVSNVGKVFFPDDGHTKGDVMGHYAALAPLVLPVTADRPLVLRRYPNGITAKAFYQHQVTGPPAGVRTEPVTLDADEPGLLHPGSFDNRCSRLCG